MAECECLPTCPFFQDRMVNKPVTADLMKRQYCLGDNAKCARHMVKVAAGAEAVPSDLFPSQTEKASKILESRK